MMPVQRKVAQKQFTLEEQKALIAGSILLINSLFDEYEVVHPWKPETIFSTHLGEHLPRRYATHYTPVTFKKFGMCVVSMAWKLAQLKPLPPSSVAEQLAAWAIFEEAKGVLAQSSNGAADKKIAQSLQSTCSAYLPDTQFLRLFDSDNDEVEMASATLPDAQVSLAIEQWFRPFAGRTYTVHPYVSEGPTRVGTAYKRCLTVRERQMLANGIDVLIDELFEDLSLMQEHEPEYPAWTTLNEHLPPRWQPKCTPLFLKQFSVCIFTVAWKLAQSQPQILSSTAEELAAWAIIRTAREQIEMEYDLEGRDGGEQAAESAFEDFIDMFFEDSDFPVRYSRCALNIFLSEVAFQA